MLVFASISVVGTVPIPAVLVLLDSLEEEFTDDVRFESFYHLSFFLADGLWQLLFSQWAEFFSANSIHDKLSSLINI